MNWKISKKTILWVIGAIVIGIASNASWEFIFRPLFLSAQGTILTLTSLGINEYKNTAYVEIAKGTYDRASLYLLGELMAFMVLAAVFVNVAFFEKIRKVKAATRAISVTVQKLEKNEIEEEIPPTIESVKSRIAQTELLFKDVVKLFIIFACASALLVTINVTSGARQSYIASAVLHFEQLIAICGPYLPEGKEKQLVSKFAQIKNLNDYERLILELRSVAESNGQSVPTFTIW